MRLLLGVVLVAVGCGGEPAPPPRVAGTAPAPAPYQPVPPPPPSQDECARLLGVVNRAVEAMKAAASDESAPVTTGLRRLADVMDRAATDIAGIELNTPALRDLAARYERMVHGVAAASRAAAEALDRGDKAAARAAMSALETAEAEEEPTIDAINGQCAEAD